MSLKLQHASLSINTNHSLTVWIRMTGCNMLQPLKIYKTHGNFSGREIKQVCLNLWSLQCPLWVKPFSSPWMPIFTVEIKMLTQPYAHFKWRTVHNGRYCRSNVFFLYVDIFLSNTHWLICIRFRFHLVLFLPAQFKTSIHIKKYIQNPVACGCFHDH